MTYLGHPRPNQNLQNQNKRPRLRRAPKPQGLPVHPGGPDPGAHIHPPLHSGSPCHGGPCADCCRRQPHSVPRSHRTTPLSQVQHWEWMVAEMSTLVRNPSHCARREKEAIPTGHSPSTYHSPLPPQARLLNST